MDEKWPRNTTKNNQPFKIKKKQTKKPKVTNPKSTFHMESMLGGFLFKKGKRGVGKEGKMEPNQNKNELGDVGKEKVPLSLLEFSKGREEQGRAQTQMPD